MEDKGDTASWHEGWDRVVNRPGKDSLICYCGEEVACYHVECLALRPVQNGGPVQ